MVNLTRDDIKKVKRIFRKITSQKIDTKPVDYFFFKCFYDANKEYFNSLAQNYRVYLYEYIDGKQIWYRLTKNGRLRKRR